MYTQNNILRHSQSYQELVSRPSAHNESSRYTAAPALPPRRQHHNTQSDLQQTNIRQNFRISAPPTGYQSIYTPRVQQPVSQLNQATSSSRLHQTKPINISQWQKQTSSFGLRSKVLLNTIDPTVESSLKKLENSSRRANKLVNLMQEHGNYQAAQQADAQTLHRFESKFKECFQNAVQAQNNVAALTKTIVSETNSALNRQHNKNKGYKGMSRDQTTKVVAGLLTVKEHLGRQLQKQSQQMSQAMGANPSQTRQEGYRRNSSDGSIILLDTLAAPDNHLYYALNPSADRPLVALFNNINESLNNLSSDTIELGDLSQGVAEASVGLAAGLLEIAGTIGSGILEGVGNILSA